MRTMVLNIIILIFALVNNACATRHTQGPSSPVARGENKDNKIEKFDNVREPIPPPPVDPKTLSTPAVSVKDQSVCKTDKALLLNADVKSSPVDYFQAKICAKNSTNCSYVNFMGNDLILGEQPAGEYDISIRSCLDPNHSTDPQNVCNDWSNPTPYVFGNLSADTMRGVNQLSDIREHVLKVCKDMQNEMQTYVDASQPGDTLRNVLKENLNTMGVNTCRDFLLSDQLQVLEAVAQSNLQGAPSASLPVGQVNLNIHSSFTEGLLLLSVGALGSGVGGYQAYRTLETTYLQSYHTLVDEIIEMDKKSIQLDIENYKMQVKLLEDLKKVAGELPNKLVEGDVTRSGELTLETGNARLDEAVNNKIEACLDQWEFANKDAAIRWRYEEGIFNRNEIKGRLQSLAGEGKFDELLTYMKSTENKLKAKRQAPEGSKSWASYLVGENLDVKIELSSADSLLWKDYTQFQKLARIVEFREEYKYARNQIAELKDVKDPQVNLNLRRKPLVDHLQLRIDALNQEIHAINKYRVGLLDYAGAAAGGLVRGAATGGGVAAVGGVAAGLHNLLPMHYLMAGGAGVGGLIGMSNDVSALRAYAKDPSWSPAEVAIRDAPDIVGMKQRNILIAELKTKMSVKEGAKSWESVKSIPKKMAFAAPWVGLMAFSGFIAYSGGKEMCQSNMDCASHFALADTNSQSALDTFITTYTKSFREAQFLYAQYVITKDQLNYGTCAAQ